MAMYVPLFAAVSAQYQKGGPPLSHALALDEAFAGVDEAVSPCLRLVGVLDFDLHHEFSGALGLLCNVKSLDIAELHRLATPRWSRSCITTGMVLSGYGGGWPMNQATADCASFFTERPAYRRILEPLLRKLPQLRPAGGTICLPDATPEECDAVRGLFGRSPSPAASQSKPRTLRPRAQVRPIAARF